VKPCPTCGQTLPPPCPDVRLTPQQARIFERVRKAGKWGIRTDDLVAWLFADREDGGPDTAVKVLHNQVFHLNKRLKLLGKVVRAPKGSRAGPSTYTLRDL